MWNWWRRALAARDERKRDRQERDFLLALAPEPTRSVAVERYAELEALERSHQAARAERAQLATDAEWE